MQFVVHSNDLIDVIQRCDFAIVTMLSILWHFELLPNSIESEIVMLLIQTSPELPKWCSFVPPHSHLE